MLCSQAGDFDFGARNSIPERKRASIPLVSEDIIN